MPQRAPDDDPPTVAGPPSRRPRQGRPRSVARSSAPAAASPADLGRVRAVIEALPEPVFVTENDGELRFTNPAADHLFADDPIQDRADLLSRFEEVAPPGAASRALPAGTGRSVTVRSRNQPNRWYALRSVPLDGFDDVGLAAQADAEPTTATSEAAGDLASAADRASAGDAGQAPADPPPRAGGRTVHLLRDVTHSRDLKPLREAFVAVLSHELRTPITTIFAGSSVLARRPSLSAAATRTLALDISSEAAHLYDLVEDLLVLASLERRVLDPLDEPVLLQRAVDATIRMIADRVTGVRIERRGEPDPPPIHGDATYVEQACRDLILAALRFAGDEPGRELVVELRSDPAAGEVQVAVLDRGPSLTPAQLASAFELPDSSAVGRLAGSGVGPFVCRNLVQSMGGRVWARNRPGGGLEMALALKTDNRT
jgi:signal transduction histidine kinase